MANLAIYLFSELFLLSSNNVLSVKSLIAIILLFFCWLYRNLFLLCRNSGELRLG